MGNVKSELIDWDINRTCLGRGFFFTLPIFSRNKTKIAYGQPDDLIVSRFCFVLALQCKVNFLKEQAKKFSISVESKNLGYQEPPIEE